MRSDPEATRALLAAIEPPRAARRFLARRARGRGGCASRRSRRRVRVGWIFERTRVSVRFDAVRDGSAGAAAFASARWATRAGEHRLAATAMLAVAATVGEGPSEGPRSVRRRAHATALFAFLAEAASRGGSCRATERRRRSSRRSGDRVSERSTGDEVEVATRRRRRPRATRYSPRFGARARKPPSTSRTVATGERSSRARRARAAACALGGGDASEKEAIRTWSSSRGRRRRRRGLAFARWTAAVSRRVRARRDDRSSSRMATSSRMDVASRRGVSRDGGDVSRATRRGGRHFSAGTPFVACRDAAADDASSAATAAAALDALAALVASLLEHPAIVAVERGLVPAALAALDPARPAARDGRVAGWFGRSTRRRPRDARRAGRRRDGTPRDSRRGVCTFSIRARVTRVRAAPGPQAAGKGAAQVPEPSLLSEAAVVSLVQALARAGDAAGSGSEEGAARGRRVRRGRGGGVGGSPVATGAPFAVVRASVRGGWRSGAGAGAKDAVENPPGFSWTRSSRRPNSRG